MKEAVMKVIDTLTSLVWFKDPSMENPPTHENQAHWKTAF